MPVKCENGRQNILWYCGKHWHLTSMCPQTLRQGLGHAVVKNKQYHASWTHEIEFWKKGRAGDRFELPELGRSLTHFREGSPSIIIFRASLTHLPVVLKSLAWFFAAKYQNWIILPSFFSYCFKILRLCGHTSVLFYTFRNKEPQLGSLSRDLTVNLAVTN